MKKRILQPVFMLTIWFAFGVMARPQSQTSMPGMDMPSGEGQDSMAGMNMPATPSSAEKNPQGPQALDATTQAMSGTHMEMGGHMKMTWLRPAQAGDQERAEKIVEQARAALAKYKDYKVALGDNFRIFAPRSPGKMKHFTNYSYAMEAGYRFNPEHPTSLLYEKHGDDYQLIGAMYTAPRRLNEDDLNQRVPLSVAQWHEHVNICFPPRGQGREMMNPHSQFGLQGSITTESACGAAGGKWVPQLFGWMVHLYPYESTPEKIWSVERQLGGQKHSD